MTGTHLLVNSTQNQQLHDYEMATKTGFDEIKPVLKTILKQEKSRDFVDVANQTLLQRLGIQLSEQDWQTGLSLTHPSNRQYLYAKCVFAQFMKLSENFFEQDPLSGKNKQQAEVILREAGVHAVGVAPCSDGRLAHIMSYVLRLPYSVARRKSHAGSKFDVSESVRHWVFIEHNRFRFGRPNSADESTSYLKIAVYHYSKADPSHQGCAAHGSDDLKAAQSALHQLEEFEQAIEDRFGCASSIKTLLLGLNTDDDSLKVHVPDGKGNLSLERFVETDALYALTQNSAKQEAEQQIEQAIIACSKQASAFEAQPGLVKLIAWLIKNNFSQIAYVKDYYQGIYRDLGHAERFIGVGSGFEEVQLRNLTYYSFLDTVEEGTNDVDVGIKIFKGLNISKGLPIPIIIRCDYDGRVPSSKTRAEKKARRIKQALHSRYQELSDAGLLYTMITLRDHTRLEKAEQILK